MPRILIGCAGWSIPRNSAARFPADGTHLQRYGARFPAVEINSSFYRPHRTSTYVRWAQSVPPAFRFSVKVPKKISHELRLLVAGELLAKFLAEVAGLGPKLGCLLVQLPPSLKFETAVATKFLTTLRQLTDVAIACEPRHVTWFSAEAEDLLRRHQVARVAADPACVPAAAEPGAWNQVAYYRLHGYPRIYYSTYDTACLQELTSRISRSSAEQTWCIFDNTALGAAAENALELMTRIHGQAELER